MSETTNDNTELAARENAQAPQRAHGEIVDEHPPPAAAGELAHRPARAEGALMPLPAEQVVAGMRAYQRLLRDLLDPSDWQTHDHNGKALDKPFLKKQGWRKIARAFNLSFERVHAHVEREENGTPRRAEVWIRAVAPNGQYGDGDGYCSADEGRFKSWRGRQKLENDLRSTATTRAKNRATADLVGMGEVSAEEIDPAGAHDEATSAALAAGAPASEELRRAALAALRWLLSDPQAAERAARRIGDDYPRLPVAAGRALVHAAAELAKTSDTTTQATAATDPAEAAPSAQHDADGEQAPQPDAPTQPTDESPATAPHVQLLERAHQDGYEPPTVHSVCALMLDKAIDELDDAERWQLSTLLETASAGAIRDGHLARAVQRALQHDDRAEARSRLYRWLIERASGAQSDQQAA